MKRRVALLALLVALASACERQRPVTFRLADGALPNLLLISIDTLRADHLGCYAGAAGAMSPNIDALAAEATLFEQASTPVPATLPALASLHTGRYPGGHPVRTNRGRLPTDIPVLAEILGRAGYDTAAFYGNSLLDPASGLGRGFTSYTSFVPLGGASDPRGVDFVRSWFDLPRQQPWFLWVHFMDPHGPYDSAPPEWSRGLPAPPLPEVTLPFSDTNYGLGVIPQYQKLGDDHSANDYRRRYAGEVHFTDAQVGRLLALLDPALRRRTLIILTADHGESLGENDYYFQHGWFPHEPAGHVPLMLRLPVERGAAHRVAEPVSLVDLLPTLLAGLELTAPAGLEGRDLRAALSGGRLEAKPTFMVTAYLNQMTALRQGGWKLVHTPKAPEVMPGDPWGPFYATAESFALYDLGAEGGEARDVSAANGARLASMREILLAWEKAHGVPMGRESAAELDPATRDRLKALGYAP